MCVSFSDLYIPGAIKSRTPLILQPTQYLRVYSGSNFLYSMLGNVDIYCKMSFEDYPVDSQNCLVSLESFGMTSKVLILKLDKFEYAQGSPLNQHRVGFAFTEGFSNYSTGALKTASFVNYVLIQHNFGLTL